MNQLGFPLLSIVLWLPTLGALLLLLVPREKITVQRGLALVVALAAFAASLPLYFMFDFSTTGFHRSALRLGVGLSSLFRQERACPGWRQAIGPTPQTGTSARFTPIRTSGSGSSHGSSR